MNMAYVIATQSADGEQKVPLPGSLHVNRRLNQWLQFSGSGYVKVFSGKVELGQGILTALAQIVAEELDVRIEQVRMIAATTAASPNEAVTSGSLSVQESGAALRQACAEARQIYMDAAASVLDTPVSGLRIEDGNILRKDGRATSYWQLADDRLLDCEATGSVHSKHPADYRVVGQPVPRVDLPDKVFGRPRFIHDLEFPGMLYASMVRPPSFNAKLVSLRDLPSLPDGARMVRDGSLLAVLAESQRDADKAAAAVASCAQWQMPDSAPAMPDAQNTAGWLKGQPVDTKVVDTRPGVQRTVARTIKASYAKPFIAHASIGPCCALAQFDGADLKVWCHSQGIYNLRKDLALAFAMSESDIIVQHVEGAGCYGHNGADDVAFDAAWAARATPGRVVRVRWSRADELVAAPFAPAMAVDMEADLDAEGKLIGWRHSVWSNGHSGRPGRAATPALLGSWHLEKPFAPPAPINAPLMAGGGSERNAVPSYDFPAWHVVNHRVLSTPIRTSAMRALGALANVFAVESFMDELAHEIGQDPIAFRLAYSTDPRARAVIETAVARSGWRKSPGREGAGWGVGFARYKNTGAYCAVVADIMVEQEVTVTRLTIAVDVGLVINPDGVINQIEGGAIQATSWALKEAVRFDRERITSDSWESYPILRFSEVPEVDVIIIPSDQPSVGAGECSLGPTAAAIGNAVFDVLGVRVRELPITAERIMALIAD
ncbi:MAG: nicotinate dehydrogenase subunit [Burkholderiales bacterium]|jgi:CO/xanthine dehydrogenase Mo-binding subunit